MKKLSIYDTHKIVIHKIHIYMMQRIEGRRDMIISDNQKFKITHITQIL